MTLTPFTRASREDITDYKEFLRRDKPRFMEYYRKKIVYKYSLHDFERLQTIGQGSFGRVFLIRQKERNKYYAAKVLDKEKIVKMEQVEHTLSEKRILQALNFPFLVYMTFYFSDNSYLYFVLPLAVGGELFTLLRKMKRLEEDKARFYTAQVCLGLDYLHYLDLVYRDLKPENLVLDWMGYIKITDLGFCKLIRSGRTYTFCGTPEYLAPEIILSKGYGFAVDWWAFGILIYELIAGFTPFYHDDVLIMYDRISNGKYKIPRHFSDNLVSLLKSLLQVEMTRRLGNLRHGSDEIREHKWFKQIHWLAILNKKIVPPYRPYVPDIREVSKNFDRYHEEPLKKNPIDQYAKYFADF